jgi:tetratricopeptide (TPR) repeat protein
LGSAQWAAGNPEEAFIDWQQGTERYPEAATLWDRLAAAYHFKGDFAAEEAALRRRLSLADDAAAQYRLGLLLMLTDAQGAREALQSAAALNQEVLPAATTLRAALSAAAVEDDHAGQMVVIGRSLGLVEEWSLAANAFASAVEADSTNAEARAWLGEARQHLSQDGRPDLDAAASMDPGSTVVHTLRGLYWRRQGNLSQSLMEYLRAVELEPRNAALQSLAGEAYTASGDLVGALTAYQTAVELAPRDSTYWSQLALFCADNGVQVLDLGVEAGLKAVELAPRDSRALDALGWAYAQGGYLTKAEQALLQALESQPANALAHLHLGLTYMRWGQGQLAMQHLQQAVQSDDGGAAGQAAAELLRTYFPAQQ